MGKRSPCTENDAVNERIVIMIAIRISINYSKIYFDFQNSLERLEKHLNDGMILFYILMI